MNHGALFVPDNWQKFFKTPTALERKRMEMVRKDFTDGKVRQSGPATIQYISDDLPKLPGEAGLRLLHTVRVGDKVSYSMTEWSGHHTVYQ